MKEIINKVRVDIISLIMVLLSIYFLGIFGLIISAVLLIIYSKTAKEHYQLQKILLALSFIGIAIGLVGVLLMGNMKNTGIDSIGEALGYAFIVNIGYRLTTLCPFLLLIIDNRKHIFKKKVILIILIVAMFIPVHFMLKYLSTTEKVGENIPTVGDFENELIKRDLISSDTDYKLYGIDQKNEKAIALSFEKNNNDKYPLYVYSIIDYPWIIYYANGEICAVRGKYWDYHIGLIYDKKSGYNEEKIIWDDGEGSRILSEKEEISVYNIKTNRYEKGNTLISGACNYYSKDKSLEDSVFVDIPRIESFGTKIEKVDRIDKKSLGE